MTVTKLQTPEEREAHADLCDYLLILLSAAQEGQLEAVSVIEQWSDGTVDREWGGCPDPAETYTQMNLFCREIEEQLFNTEGN